MLIDRLDGVSARQRGRLLDLRRRMMRIRSPVYDEAVL